jgi:hypothetical protein
VPHKLPNYVASFDRGLDHLYSVERIQWNAATDRIVLGKGVGLVEDDIIFGPGASADGHSRAQMRSGRLVPEESAPLGNGTDTAAHAEDDALIFRPGLMSAGSAPAPAVIDAAPGDASIAPLDPGAGAHDIPLWTGVDLDHGWLF